MYSRGASILIGGSALVPLVLTLLLYPRLPDVMASHWNFAGQVDGSGSRPFVAFLVPVITLVMWGVFMVLPRIAPARPAFESAGRYMTEFIVVIMLFFTMVHAQLLLWNIGHEIPFMRTVPAGIGVLFIFVGRLLGHVEPNWVVGIRTYWTLKNPVVWVRTHQRASLLFRILGIIYIIASFFRGYILLFILLPAVFLALYLPAYSFLLYQKIEQVHGGGDVTKRT